MDAEFYRIAQDLKNRSEPFAIATIVGVKGSASAKPGSKAIFDKNGKNLWGWVGGGCAETFVSENCLEAMEAREPRTITADLDDEILGLGMPCGGYMDIFIEPELLPESLTISTDKTLFEALRHISKSMGYAPRFESVSAHEMSSALEQGLLDLAYAISQKRGGSFRSLREIKGGDRSLPLMLEAITPSELLLIGGSRITEEMAKLGVLMRWPVRIYGWNLAVREFPAAVRLEESGLDRSEFEVKAGSFVFVASHHRGDPMFISKSLQSGAAYVGLIASGTRAPLVAKEVECRPEQLAKLYAPAGLDLGCRTPAEIALSVLAEILILNGLKPSSMHSKRFESVRVLQEVAH